jgi:hypothetical protein
MSHPRSIRMIRPHASLPLAGAVIHGGTVYVSGQVGFKSGTSELAGSDVASQVRQTMANVDAVLAAAGSDRSPPLRPPEDSAAAGPRRVPPSRGRIHVHLGIL